MSDDARREVFDQLRSVIAWEVEAQMGMRRRTEDLPLFIADTLLDFFDVTLKDGAEVPRSDD